MSNDYSEHDEETLLAEYHKLLDETCDPAHTNELGDKYRLKDMHSEIVNRGLEV